MFELRQAFARQTEDTDMGKNIAGTIVFEDNSEAVLSKFVGFEPRIPEREADSIFFDGETFYCPECNGAMEDVGGRLICCHCHPEIEF
jgi:hypothetical protein